MVTIIISSISITTITLINIIVIFTVMTEIIIISPTWMLYLSPNHQVVSMYERHGENLLHIPDLESPGYKW
jgi:hypothetical protein